jgi:hypothetical protein
MELKSPSIPLFPPGQRPKGETPIPLPFVKPVRLATEGGGEGLFLFQKAKFILLYLFSSLTSISMYCLRVLHKKEGT